MARIQVWVYGLQKWNVGAGWLVGDVGFGTDYEVRSGEVREGGYDLSGVKGWV